MYSKKTYILKVYFATRTRKRFRSSFRKCHVID